MIERARHRQTPTILFIDEIHRFNKAQQDALLPARRRRRRDPHRRDDREPSLRVNSALLSRVTVFELERAHRRGHRDAADRARSSSAAWASRWIADDAELLAERSGGDARLALGALERAAALGRDGHIDLAAAREALTAGLVRYDRAGDQHYDTISAWIKATRGSDPDASLYYLATMLEGGEDPRFIARRMVILASEDIGNADPHALVARGRRRPRRRARRPARSAATRWPRRRSASRSPRSPTPPARALGAARELIRAEGARPAPPQLRGAADYDYPHDRPGGVSPQELMPEGLEDVRFYAPGESEARWADALARVRAARGRTP